MIPKFSAGALALAFVFSRAPGPAGSEPDLATVRSATLKFQDVKAAMAEGYVREPMNRCDSAETTGRAVRLGAMDIHYVSPELRRIEASSAWVKNNGTPSDFRKPAVLVYEPRPDGSLQLVAAEDLVFRWAWRDPDRSETPGAKGAPDGTMKDDSATKVDEAHMFVPYYDRHVWIFRDGPNRVSGSYHPDVTCAAHEAVVAARGGHQDASDREA